MENNMEKIGSKTKLLLGAQHVLAMFGATVLVPFLTGLNPSIALIAAGAGTLIFHFCTKRIVPVFLGSSFAFIGALTLVLKEEGIGAVKGGVIAAGFIYLVMAYLVKIFGVEKIKSFFPPVVTGPIIMVIGLRMSPVALSMAGYANGKFDPKSLIIALVVIISMISITIMKKSFFRLVPILISVTLGYIVAMCMGLVSFEPIAQANWIGLSSEAANDLFTLPNFSVSGVLAIAPIALVVFIEHIGDITTNGNIIATSGDIKVLTNNIGNIASVGNITGRDVMFTTQTGNIKVNENRNGLTVNSGNNFIVQTATGDIILGGTVKSGNEAKAETTTNGNINIKNIISQNDMYVLTNVGNIEIGNAESINGKVYIKSSGKGRILE